MSNERKNEMSFWPAGELKSLGFLHGFVDGADHVESLFGQIVVVAFENLGKTLDGVFDGNVFAGRTSKLLGDEEWLGEEALDLAGAGNGEFIFVGEFVDAQNGDDVLEVFVALKDFLDALGGVVVVAAEDVWGQD